MCEEKSGGLLKTSRLIIGGGCLNEALNWSVKGFGGLTYSPNLLLEVSTNLNSSFFIYYFDCAISQDSDLT